MILSWSAAQATGTRIRATSQKTPDPKQKDQVFTLKQNYTILVKAEELGKDTGARIVFAGGKSGTQGNHRLVFLALISCPADQITSAMII